MRYNDFRFFYLHSSQSFVFHFLRNFVSWKEWIFSSKGFSCFHLLIYYLIFCQWENDAVNTFFADKFHSFDYSSFIFFIIYTMLKILIDMIFIRSIFVFQVENSWDCHNRNQKINWFGSNTQVAIYKETWFDTNPDKNVATLMNQWRNSVEFFRIC